MSMEKLGANTYPGRGIVIGESEDGKSAVIAYFIMGRSVNSRNRKFAAYNDGIRTEAVDPAKLTDPSLIIYSPVRVLGEITIVTNGDQTDTVYEHLTRGGTFESALDTREFEPDAPNYTPRISGLVSLKDGSFSYKLGICRRGNDGLCVREYYDYAPVSGMAKLIHTYMSDGDPLPSFTGAPRDICVTGGLNDFAEELWESLNNENKVALFVRYINLASGKAETRIINKS